VAAYGPGAFIDPRAASGRDAILLAAHFPLAFLYNPFACELVEELLVRLEKAAQRGTPAKGAMGRRGRRAR